MKSFDDRTAIFLAAVCNQTYVQFNNSTGLFVVPQSYERVAEFHAKSFIGQLERFGFILQSEDQVIIAFRGTSSTADWISDAIARQRKYKCVPGAGRTHAGISDIYYSARGQILSALGKLSEKKALTIIGHSLGGALAALCAVDVSTNSEFAPPTVYTYGSPRVGDPAFARAYSSHVGQSFRINNWFDAVTHLPPHIYKPPGKDATYHYMHVRDGTALPFHNGSVSSNHVIGSYYRELAKRNIPYAKQLSQRNPCFCPPLKPSAKN